MDLVRRAVLSLLLLGCSSSEPAAKPVETYTPPPRVQIVEPGIVRELVDVEGVTPPKNPTLDRATPSEQNRVRVVRYRVEGNKPARAIVILMPGFLGGAGSFDPMARALVRRSGADGAIEAWAIDRRANYLEDTHGDDVAEVKRDPELARRYYFDGEPVAGKTFTGFIDQSELPHESEWGAETTLGDLRNVIAKVPAAERRARVILLGHSLGATLCEAYAAWDFAGQRGFDELAGLVLVDGVANRELDAATTFSEKTYLEGSPDSTNPFASAGLQTIRKVQPFVALPFLGVAVMEHGERMAVATAIAPSGPRLQHDDIVNTASILLGLKRDAIPKMTNRALFGFAFDDASSAVFIAAISTGHASGGPLGSYEGILGGELVHPTDPNGSYDWMDFDATSPPERSRLSDMARSWYEGPGLNFAEWYFPSRLALDVGVVGSLNIAEDDWRTRYGLRARHGGELDLPVLAFAAELTPENRFDKLRAMLTRPIGAGRPLAGIERTDERAYRLIVRPQFTHIDPIQAADVGEGKVWYDELAAFIASHTPTGGVAVP